MFVHTKWLCVKMECKAHITKLSNVYNNLCIAFYLPIITTTHVRALFSVSVWYAIVFLFRKAVKNTWKIDLHNCPSVLCHSSFLCLKLWTINRVIHEFWKVWMNWKVLNSVLILWIWMTFLKSATKSCQYHGQYTATNTFST